MIPVKVIRVERGISLITSLIMLTALTLMVIAGIRLSNSGFRIAVNAQEHMEAQNLAQQAIETKLEDSTFFKSPPTTDTTVVAEDATVASSATGAVAASDVNGDGKADYTVTVYKPHCLSSTQSTDDPSGTFVTFKKYDTVWDVKAVVQDSKNGTCVQIHQGVKVKLGQTDTGASCPDGEDPTVLRCPS